MKNKGESLTYKNIRFSSSTSTQIVSNLYGSFRSSRDFCGEVNSQNICKNHYCTLGTDVHHGFLASKVDGSLLLALRSLIFPEENHSIEDRDQLHGTGKNTRHEDGKLNPFTERNFNKHLSL